MNLEKPQSIIFDWDNTLVNTWPIIHAALNATMRAYNQPEWTFDMTRQRVKKSMRDSFPEIFGADWQEASETYQREYRNQHLLKLEPLPDVIPVLEAIKKSGLFCAVVSNKKGDNLRTEIAHLGWGHYFHSVVGATDAARDKPFCDPVEMAYKESKAILAKHAWFIGDSEIDLECAGNTGCTAILYGEFARTQESWNDKAFGGFSYDAYAVDHTELLALFKRFSQ